MMPNSSSSRTGAISANSTIDCERCERRSGISITADGHVGVRHDVHRVAEHALHEPGDEAKAHDEDDVHVDAFQAVVVRRRREIETRCLRVADEKARYVE